MKTNRAAFTDTALSAIAATGERFEIRDPKTSGLFLRIGAEGGKSWYLGFRMGGRYYRERMGDFQKVAGGTVTMTVKQAREAFVARRALLGMAGEPARKQKAAECAMTLEQVWKLLKGDDLYKVAEHTHATRDSIWALHIKPVLGGTRLADIDEVAVERLRNKLADKRYSGRMINEVLTIINLIYKYAVKTKLLPVGHVSPAKNLRVKVAKPRRRHLSQEEFAPFWAALEQLAFRKHENLSSGYFRTVADAFRMMLFTGARSQNVKTMRWRDVSLTRRVWTVPATFTCACGKDHGTKTGERYEIPLTSQAVEILKRRHAGPAGETDFVFPGRGEAPHLGELKHVWSTVISNAGLEGLTIHDLRRTQGCVQAAQGVNLALIGESLCHDDLESTKVYAHASGLDQLRENMERANRAMLAAGTDEPLVLSLEEWEEIADVLERAGSALAAKVRGVADGLRIA